MWFLPWLACATAPLPPTTVRGLQVVAITANPPQPTQFQDVDLEVWVADGLGLGAEVLVWMCNPADGRCVEFEALPGSDGLPLDFVTKVGIADPVFRTTVSWPFLAGIAGEYVSAEGEVLGGEVGEGVPGILIWAVACVPGVCETLRQVKSGPVAGSPTWNAATDALSDPALILAEVAPGEASLAVRFLPLWDPIYGIPGYYLPNSAPLLELDGNDDPPRTRRVNWIDFDGDNVKFQAFTTGGTTTVGTEFPNQVTVTHEPDRYGWGDLFLVADDGRGGSSVWASTAEQRDACAPFVRLPNGPEPGELLTIEEGSVYQALMQVRGFAPGSVLTATVSTDTRELLRGTANVPSYGSEFTYPYDSGLDAYTFDPCAVTTYANYLTRQFSFDPCAVSGKPATLRLEADDFDRNQVTVEIPVVLRSEGRFCP